MRATASLHREIEQDIWAWINEFVTVPNEAYQFKFPPCPYARQAVLAGMVDVKVWQSGDVRAFIRDKAGDMRDSRTLSTRVMVFPPRTRWHWRIGDYVDTLNAALIPDNVFLNTGVAKTTTSRFPGSFGAQPYFIVVANRLDAVLAGCELLKSTHYYESWPRAHVQLVVERRARMAKRYGKP